VKNYGVPMSFATGMVRWRLNFPGEAYTVFERGKEKVRSFGYVCYEPF
jgi:hypothetical protein